jgi:hypothetical protein
VEVTVIGSGFHIYGYESSVKCLFGSVSTPAVVVNDSVVECTSPPHPAGKVVVAVQLLPTGSVIGSVSRSIQTFIYEEDLVLQSIIPQSGQLGSVTYITVTAKTLGSAVAELDCRWNMTLKIPTRSFGPTIFIMPAVRLNSTHARCATPSPEALYIDTSNTEWFLNSNASATVSLSKNSQLFSTELPFFLFAKPGIHSITPKLGVTSESTQITINGYNFLQTQNAGCKVGSEIYPAQVVSSSTAVCTTNATSIKLPVYQVSVLGPYIRHEIQRLEFWQRSDIYRKFDLSGTITLSL